MLERIAKFFIGGGVIIACMWWFGTNNQSFDERIYDKNDYAQDISKIYFDLGNKLSELNDLPAAIDAYTSAIEIKQDFLIAHDRLGICYEQQGNRDAALLVYLKAMSIDPNFIEARFSQTHAHIARSPEYQLLCEKTPWTGQDLHEKKVYIFTEKGLGDTLQFCRFLGPLKQRGAHIILKAPSSLITLLKETFPDVEYLDHNADTSKLSYDFYSSLLSIPHYLGTTCSTIPDCGGYMSPPSSTRNALQGAISHTNKLKVGLVWQGDKNHINDKNRSLPLSQLYDLTLIPKSTFYSLQKGYGAEQLAHLPKHVSITALEAHLQDFASTAAIIKNLDAVVCVDTAVAHLAGALGKPVLLMVPSTPDWRWLGSNSSEKTVWYNSMRIYRQQRAGDWKDVVGRVKKDLSIMAYNKSKHRSVHFF